MFNKRAVLCVVALCCLVAIAPSALYPQSASTGTVNGTVSDWPDPLQMYQQI